MKDLVCFADNYVFEVDETQSKINNNELVIGPTRSGKTMSIVEPRLLHTFHSSLVVTVTKRKLVDQYKEIFKKRGYLIIDLDFTNNKNGKSYYDPFQYIKSEEDVIDLADKIVNDKNIPDDPYWYDSAKSILISLISLTYINAKSRNEKPTLQEFIILYNNLQIDYSKNNITSNYDYIFENLNKYYPNNLASSCWKTIKNLASKTASCILSMVNTVIDKLFTKTIVDNTKNKDCIDFIKLVSRKTIMFITTSAVNESANNYIGLMYSDLFKQLITYSERRNDKVLPRPIHIICDDFATGTKIAKLEEYMRLLA